MGLQRSSSDWLVFKGTKPEPVAYPRILSPAKGIAMVSIGRVLTHPKFRGKGLGKEIMKRGLESIAKV